MARIRINESEPGSFIEVFYDMCCEKGVTPTSACVEMGLANSTWNGWKRGCEPRPESIRRVAKYFETSSAEIRTRMRKNRRKGASTIEGFDEKGVRRRGDFLERRFTENGKRYSVYGRSQDELDDKECKKREEAREVQAARSMGLLPAVFDDAFLELPATTRCLYFYLSMFADDEGRCSNVTAIMRMISGDPTDLQALQDNDFIRKMDSPNLYRIRR